MEGDLQVAVEPGTRVIRRETGETRATADQTHDQKVSLFVNHVVNRWKTMADAEEPQRRRSVEEVEFNSGKHWDDTLRKEREDKDRVVMEINRTPQYLNQVSNAQRMARPAILVKPNGNGADEDSAQVKQGIIRSIERRSDAESIRDECFYSVLEKGWSYRRVSVEYEHERSNRLVIRLKRIFDDFSVFCDPAATELDRSDADDWVIVHDMTPDMYYDEYSDSKLASMTQVVGLGDVQRTWISPNVIRVVEYWYREKTREKLYTLADDPYGDGRWEDELEENDGRLVGVAYVEDEPVYRWSVRARIFVATVNAVEVLDGNDDGTAGREWVPGAKYIPIVPDFGRRVLFEKRPVHVGMVRDAIEPCLASDYWLSAITEMVALGPKAPWIVCYEAIAQYREMWDQSNIENYAALYYDHTDDEGNELPAPFRNFGEPPIQAMTFILNYAEEDLKRVMGIYQRSLGAPGPEHSGIAIRQVQQEADVANYNYVDNHKRSVEHESRIYLDLQPLVLDAPQVIEIVRPEATSPERVWINKTFKGPNGEDKRYDMARGNYDVEVEIGPSMATRREAAAQGILEYIKVDPGAAPFVGDLLANNTDSPDKNELVKRLKMRAQKMGAIPPDADSKTDPDQVKQQYQAQAQQLEQTTQALQALQEQIKTEEIKYAHQREIEAMKIASAERIKAMDSDAKLAVTELTAKFQRAQQATQAAIDKVNSDVAAVREERTSWLDRIFKYMTPGTGDGGSQPRAGGGPPANGPDSSAQST